MTHATITPHGRHCAVTMPIYNHRNERYAAAKDAVKELAGAEYIGGSWVVSVLHLPTLKAIFDTMTVDPAVVVVYHDALRQMLDQLLPSAHRKGALGQHIAELTRLHANGIAAIKKAGYVPPTHRHIDVVPIAKMAPVDGVAATSDPALTVWLAGAKNAHKAAEKKKAIVAAKKRKRKAEVTA